jgi:hypothetical protein
MKGRNNQFSHGTGYPVIEVIGVEGMGYNWRHSGVRLARNGKVSAVEIV